MVCERLTAIRTDSVPVLLHLLKPHRNRVHTVSQPGWLRAIVEDVPEMSAAARAEHFGPLHAERSVRFFVDASGFDRCPETRPAGTRFEFRRRAKERVATPCTDEDASAMLIEQRARKRPLRAGIAQHIEGRR